MAMITCTIDKTSNIPILLGGTSGFEVKIKNISTNMRLYNLNIYLTLPDGLDIYSSSIPVTSKLVSSDGVSKISWINLKDLEVNEVEYVFNITIKANTVFKSGTTIPFGYIFSDILVRCEMDTMPRGNYDIGNIKEFAEVPMTFKSVRFYNTIATSGKVLKGAGTSALLNNYTKVYTATCQFFNNGISKSNMNITLLLENGIRYLGNITATGTDSQSFLNPKVATVNINNKVYIQLYYGNVTLSINSITTISFKYAVWNKYNENTGAFIVHGSKLNMLTNMNSLDDSVDNSVSFSAMDLIISTSVNKQFIDIEENVQFNYTYEVGGYYDIRDVYVNYILPDGISYISSSVAPYYNEENPSLNAFELKYYFNYASMNSNNTVIIYCKSNSSYKYKLDSNLNTLPIVAFDSFAARTSIKGTKVQDGNDVSDSSSTSCSIKVPTVSKEFLKGYYRDGTAKTINYLSPGDLAEYRLTYDSRLLKAVQKQIYLDDFFPLSADPINNINYTITGYNPASSPKLIDPHGVDFYYGDIPGNSLSTITFKVPIKYMGAPAENTNLLKLKGLNTSRISYSSRTQVTVNIGLPNIQLTKTVTGPNKTSIRAGEVYNYNVRISNTNTLGTEVDAFNIVLSDELSTWFSINSNSISVSGSGAFGTVTYDGSSIQVPISKLSPGAYVTLIYSVTISNLIAPSVSIKTTASNTNPYSQIYNVSLDNYQYSNLNKTAAVTINSQAITVNKINNNITFKVGSEILYTITVNIPIGTVVQDLYVRDTLSNGNQVYNGLAFRNGIKVTPTVSSNIVTFSNEGFIDARNSSQVIVYIINCKIVKGTKILSSTISTQNNTVQVLFRQRADNLTWSTVSKTLSVTINHPNIVMELLANVLGGQGGYKTSNNVISGSILDFRLNFTNNSKVALVNGTIEIPINNNFIFSTIKQTQGCTAVYNSSSKKIVITILRLESSVSGFVTFTVSCLSNLRSGTTINTQGVATKYYNDISPTIVYGGEQSNICLTILPPNVSLLPDESDKVDDSTSYRLTKPGGTVTILNHFKNTGGGYDDYNISLKAVGIPYMLYIDNIKTADVPKNTAYSANLDIFKNIPPQGTKVIKIVAIIPKDDPLGCRYNFIVTVKSNTSPYPEKTVLNIDPT